MLLPIGVLILLGMAGTVLYNQLAGLYNDAVKASRDWAQAYQALQEAIRQLPEDQQSADWLAKSSDLQAIANTVYSAASMPPSLRDPLRNCQIAYRQWTSLQGTYHAALKRFPVSALAKVFKFSPVELS